MTKTTAVLSLLATAFLLTFACLTAQAAGQASNASPGTTEATKVASDWWHRYVAHCGESYYVFGKAGILTEYKQVSMQMKAEPLSEAQKLNGLSWQGQSVFLAKLARDIYLAQTNPEWRQWVDGGALYVNMTKLNVQWSMASPMNDR